MVQEPQLPAELGFVMRLAAEDVVEEALRVVELDIKAAAFTILTITKRVYLRAIMLAARSSKNDAKESQREREGTKSRSN
jgi:hypothetical protein